MCNTKSLDVKWAYQNIQISYGTVISLPSMVLTDYAAVGQVIYNDEGIRVELWGVDLGVVSFKSICIQETDGTLIQQCKLIGCIWKKWIQEIIKSDHLLLRGNYWHGFQQFGLLFPTSVAFAVIALNSWWQIDQV
jgi:hypothetical protein